MRHLVAAAGLAARVAVDSAGTGAWHVDEPPDPRTADAARRRGVVLEGSARQFRVADFSRFDYVLAMDRANRDALLALAPTPTARAKVRLVRSFDPEAPADAEVPDPYYGGPRGFDDVFEICEAACRGLLDHLAREHGW
jgi:protein-tyrosine phosphatase